MARSRTPLSVSAGGASNSFRACASPSAGVRNLVAAFSPALAKIAGTVWAWRRVNAFILASKSPEFRGADGVQERSFPGPLLMFHKKDVMIQPCDGQGAAKLSLWELFCDLIALGLPLPAPNPLFPA